MTMNSMNNIERLSCGAYAQVLALKLAYEHDGLVMAIDGIIKLNYPQLVTPACLPDIAIDKEFIAEDKCLRNSQLFREQESSMQGSHLVRVLTKHPFNTLKYMSDIGYTMIADKKLMYKDTSDKEDTVDFKDIKVSVIIDKHSTAAFSIDGACDEAQYFNFFALFNEKIVCRAQAAITHKGAAFISDIFTEPAYRRQGYAKALLNNIIDELQSFGTSRIILIPSPMTSKIRLYENFGFKNERFVLIFKK